MIPVKQWAAEQRPDLPVHSAHAQAIYLIKSGRLPSAVIVDISACRRRYEIPADCAWPDRMMGGRPKRVRCACCGK